jgi:hypothetical protein
MSGKDRRKCMVGVCTDRQTNIPGSCIHLHRRCHRLVAIIIEAGQHDVSPCLYALDGGRCTIQQPDIGYTVICRAPKDLRDVTLTRGKGTCMESENAPLYSPTPTST